MNEAASETEFIEEKSILQQKIHGLEQPESKHRRVTGASLESEEHYRFLSENIASGFAYCKILFDQERPQDFIYLDVNSAFESLTGLTNVIGKKVSEVIPGIRESDWELFEIYGRVALTGKSERFEKYVEALKNWFAVSVSSPKKEYIVAIFDVITERKRTEEALKASLREKEILLKEVHHRVKNNMQVISSLFDLQAASSGNSELTKMCRESQRRIRSMALIHEKLYHSKDFTRVDLAGYVRSLARELFQACAINPGKIDTIFQTDGDIYVDIYKAIPCGLILNELISNALKHAFAGDGIGELRIIMGETNDRKIEIIVRDNGSGLPDSVDIRAPRSVGLYLVSGLVKNQLSGQIEIKRDNGTEFRIKFPL